MANVIIIPQINVLKTKNKNPVLLHSKIHNNKKNQKRIVHSAEKITTQLINVLKNKTR
jgi:hypothetical protein